MSRPFQDLTEATSDSQQPRIMDTRAGCATFGGGVCFITAKLFEMFDGGPEIGAHNRAGLEGHAHSNFATFGAGPFLETAPPSAC